ncbi:MAG: hypothetical protein L6R41_000987 [Letrouitia leprolyta]|nr:MAG: hypothetical protein L6R41_000987 [Letrouitia leprolyta]
MSVIFRFLLVALTYSSSNALPVADDSPTNFAPLVIDASSNPSAFDIPIHPISDLRNINIEIRVNPGDARGFDPAQLYYSIFSQIVQMWKLPALEPITSSRHLPAVGFQVPDTYMIPSPGSRLLTTVVANAVLLRMLEVIDLRNPFVPLLIQATLSTKDTRRAAGVIRAVWPPATTTTAASAHVAVTEIQTSNGISIEIEFDGQSPQYRLIEPRYWLYSFRSLTTTVFGRHVVDEPVKWNPQHPELVSMWAEGDTYRLYSEISMTGPIPRGHQQVTWGQVLDGLSMVFKEVVEKQKYELFRASISFDGWKGVTYSFYFLPRPRLTSGGTETA